MLVFGRLPAPLAFAFLATLSPPSGLTVFGGRRVRFFYFLLSGFTFMGFSFYFSVSFIILLASLSLSVCRSEFLSLSLSRFCCLVSRRPQTDPIERPLSVRARRLVRCRVLIPIPLRAFVVPGSVASTGAVQLCFVGGYVGKVGSSIFFFQRDGGLLNLLRTIRKGTARDTQERLKRNRTRHKEVKLIIRHSMSQRKTQGKT